MVKTKYTGVYYRDTVAGDRVFYIRGKLKGRNYEKKVGTREEGVTAAYASKVRAEHHSLKRMGEESPMHKEKQYTLNEASKLYFEKVKHKSNTENMRSQYANHIMGIFGNRQLQEITLHDIENFKGAKLDEVSFKTDRKIEPATVNRLIDMISAIYNYMAKYHKVKCENPCKGVERYKMDNKRERYLEPSEIKQLLEAVKNSKKLRKKELAELFILLALTTGARRESILNIKKSDIKGDRITIKDFKSNETYIAHVHPSVREKLDAVLERIRPIDHIIGERAQPMHGTGIYKMIQPVLDEQFNADLNIDDRKRRVVIHTFRHTFASLLAISGTPIYTIKNLLNHSDIKMTMRYAKLAPDTGAESVKNLEI